MFVGTKSFSSKLNIHGKKMSLILYSKVAALDLGYGAGVADVVAAKPKVKNVQQNLCHRHRYRGASTILVVKDS